MEAEELTTPQTSYERGNCAFRVYLCRVKGQGQEGTLGPNQSGKCPGEARNNSLNIHRTEKKVVSFPSQRKGSQGILPSPDQSTVHMHIESHEKMYTCCLHIHTDMEAKTHRHTCENTNTCANTHEHTVTLSYTWAHITSAAGSWFAAPPHPTSSL